MLSLSASVLVGNKIARVRPSTGAMTGSGLPLFIAGRINRKRRQSKLDERSRLVLGIWEPHPFALATPGADRDFAQIRTVS